MYYFILSFLLGDLLKFDKGANGFAKGNKGREPLKATTSVTRQARSSGVSFFCVSSLAESFFLCLFSSSHVETTWDESFLLVGDLLTKVL